MEAIGMNDLVQKNAPLLAGLPKVGFLSIATGV
jgi:hypothetical protein